MTDTPTTALTNNDFSPAATPITTGAGVIEVDTSVRLYAITTGGTGGIEGIDLQFPDLPVGDFANPAKVGLRITFYIDVQTNPSDVVQLTSGGNTAIRIYPCGVPGNSRYADTDNGVILNYVGAMAQFVWVGDRWDFDIAVTGANDSSTFLSATFRAITPDATNANVGNVILGPGAHSGTGNPGNLMSQNIPTADPLVVNAIWNNGGVLTVSAG